MSNHDPYAPFEPLVIDVEEVAGEAVLETPEGTNSEDTKTPEVVEEVAPVDLKVGDVLDWVGADKNRARLALAAEQEARGDKARKSLVESLKDLIG